jgi:PAS domain S-box-containing protein/putative nucleotidyltransferase with HDIG domain
LNRENVMSVLYDIALVIGGEDSLYPLLTKTVQRILYHTSFPTGLVFLDVPVDEVSAVFEVQLDAAVGDFGYTERVGQTLRLPADLLRGPAAVGEDPQLLHALPGATRDYRAYLRLPIDHEGVLLLLSPHLPKTQLPLAQVFQPVMANLAKAILLCRHNDAYAAGLLAEREMAQQSLEESEEKFRSITDAAQDAIILIDDQGLLGSWNPAAERIFGYTAEEAMGREAHRLIVPERYYHSFTEGFERFRTTGSGPIIGKTVELEGRRKDGGEFPVELSVSALRLDERWHAVGILRDITERKRDEEALRRSEESLKQAQRIAHMGNWDLDLVNDVLLWSDEIYRIFEIDHARFGASYGAFLDAIHPGDREMVNAAYTESVKNRTGYDIVHRLLMPDGRVKYVNERCETFYDDEGRPLRSVGTVQDITERRESEIALQLANRALKTLSGCNGILVRATDEARLIEDICHLIVDTGGYPGAWVGYAEEGGTRLQPVASAGIDPGYLVSLELGLTGSEEEKGPAARAYVTGKTQIVPDIAGDADYPTHREAALQRGIVSTIALPLAQNGASFGVLKVYAAEREAFSVEEVALLNELAEDLAFGIVTLRTRAERKRLESAEHDNAERLQQALLGTIQAVALTVEKRDPYTAGHQLKVAHLAVAIASELGWPADKIEGVRLGAMIHDIGKIYVPSEILNRPSKLSDLEFEVIKRHPQVGYEIVEKVAFPWPVAQIILQHHERLDGSGYPQQLSGDAIIAEARVLAVADVVEAIASHRPYRPALGIEAGLEEVQRHRGTLYDAEVVDACMRVFRERGFTFEESPFGEADDE